MATAKISVIVIDDDPDVRSVMQLALKMDGRCEVIGLGQSADDAIWLASTYSPDAIVLDVRMPEMDGLAALPSIRRHAPDAKVLVFSVLDEELMRPKLERAGVDDYVPKGTAPGEIVERIVELCRGDQPD